MTSTMTVSCDYAEQDYENAARELLGQMLETDNAILKTQYAMSLGDILGTPGEMSQYLSGSSGERKLHIDRLARLFEQNVCLLIDKTWVERHDETAKERLIERTKAFAAKWHDGDPVPLVAEFVSIAEDFAVLMFGDIAREADFTDYALRVDPRLGLFYGMVADLKQAKKTRDEDCIRLELLVGVYFLASF